MPEQFRERILQLSRLCTALIETMSAGRQPARAQVEALRRLVELLRPSSRADPFAGLWHVLDAVETVLSIAADETSPERVPARELALGQLKRIAPDLDGFMA